MQNRKGGKQNRKGGMQNRKGEMQNMKGGMQDRKGGMQDTEDRKGGMQDRRDVEKEKCRKGGIQNCMNAGEEGFRTGWMHPPRLLGSYLKDRLNVPRRSACTVDACSTTEISVGDSAGSLSPHFVNGGTRLRQSGSCYSLQI